MLRTGIGWRAGARFCAGAIALGTLAATATPASAGVTTAAAATAAARHGVRPGAGGQYRGWRRPRQDGGRGR